MQSVARLPMPSIAAGVSGAVSALAGAPWWLSAAGFGLCAFGLVVMAIQAVFPQESGDRLDWWREFWEYRRTRRRAEADELPRTR